MHKYLLLLFSLIQAIFVSANNKIYYVDNVLGNDNNNGTTKTSAWHSLQKLTTITFEPGDKICFKRDQIFEGSLFLKGSGNKENCISITAYGVGSRPVIKSTDEYAIKLIDAQYWEISDIETTGGEKAGIFIGCSKDNLVLNHFRITNCYVHDVGNDSSIDWKFSTLTGGIVIANGHIVNDEKLVYSSVINDAVIDGCIVRYIKRWTGISITSGKINGLKGDKNHIANCTVEYTASDAIRMNGVKNSFIESSVMYMNGTWPDNPNKHWGGLGAWFFDADSCTIQFCEASYINNAHNDGGAFDIDYLQTYSTVQYCYGHDCYGYGVSVFGADSTYPTINSTVRNNLFVNNGKDSTLATKQGDFFVYTWNGGSLDGVKIYNNISLWNPVTYAAALQQNADFTGTNENIFSNNIISSKCPFLLSLKNNSLRSDSNLYIIPEAGASFAYETIKYNSLKNWKENTGQDMHSKYCTAIEDAGDYLKRPVNKINNKKILQVYSDAPAFSINAVNGKDIQLKDYAGSPVLISFIDVVETQSDSIPNEISQLTFLKSMQRQYEKKGLKIILVDVSYLNNSNATDEFWKNFISDNELQDIPVIKDDKKNISNSYGVIHSPTSFLISAKGVVMRKWEDVAVPFELAAGIEELIAK